MNAKDINKQKKFFYHDLQRRINNQKIRIIELFTKYIKSF